MVVDRLQPRRAIRIVERMACAHFGDISWRVEIVRVVETPAQLTREFEPHRGFAAARNAHEYDDQRRFHLPCPRADRVAPFVKFVKIEKRLDRFSHKSEFHDSLLEEYRTIIAPADFCHETI